MPHWAVRASSICDLTHIAQKLSGFLGFERVTILMYFLPRSTMAWKPLGPNYKTSGLCLRADLRITGNAGKPVLLRLAPPYSQVRE